MLGPGNLSAMSESELPQDDDEHKDADEPGQDADDGTMEPSKTPGEAAGGDD